MRKTIPVIFFLAIISACSLQTLNEVVEPDPAQRNVHKECRGCHGDVNPRTGKDLFEPGIEPTMVCLFCHHYSTNHHPVNFIPTGESYFTDCGMSPLPLFEGEVRCLTCHQAHGGEGLAETPRLLRGGPYADRRDICFECHYAERYAGIYVHQMLDAEGRTRKVDGEPICLVCHSALPNPERDRTADVRFKADVAFLCWRCHPPMPGKFFEHHFMASPREAMMAYIRGMERNQGVLVPLVPRDRITCSTCHNPHEAGVIVSPPARLGENRPSRLRLPKAELCEVCHKVP